jgi:DNA repair photolyase
MLSKQLTGAAGYFMSFSDPFLSLEDYYHNTQEAAMEFHRVGLPVFFLSRLAYPSWAIDLLSKNPYSYAQKSLNTPDPEDWTALSPGALPLLDHMEEIRELKRRGIYVSIQCNPVVPGIVTHDDVERLFEMLAEAGADHVIVKFVEAGFSWAPAMVDRIVQRFGDNRAAGFRDLFTQNIGSMRTVDEEYRMEGHRRYRAKATKLGLSYATCFEYRRERDASGTILPGAGVSVGHDFLTADQCHGHRVPMFTRNRSTSDSGKPVMFREVSECPPSGCLTCGSDNGGEPRCGNIERGLAKAMKPADYRLPVR